MNRRNIILSAAVVLFAALCSPALRAEGFWDGGYNVSGVRLDPTVKGSNAELYGNYIGGLFKSSSQPVSAWTVGAKASSLVHFDKLSLTGSFGFEQFNGKGMAGSMFITPETYPVDVIEFTPGPKVRQKYSMSGGIAYDIAPEWTIGVKVDFLSANYSKRKDVRHTNYRLDMDVAPGFVYHADDFAVGLNYIYRRDTESIEADQIGFASEPYYAFLSKGLLYGAYGVWDGSGLHLDETGTSAFPIIQNTHGAAAQFTAGGFFAEAEYRHSSGAAGEKDRTWFRFPGHEVSVNLSYRLPRPSATHTFRLKGSWKTVSNYETVLETTTSGGIVNVVEYGSNLTYVKDGFILKPQYNLVMKQVRAAASVEASWLDEQASPMYPYIYGQKTFRLGVNASVAVPVRGFLPAVAVGFGTGNFTTSSSMASETSGVETEPYKLEGYWAGQMEYLTCTRFTVNPSLRYTFAMGLYLEAAANVLKAFDIKILKGSVRYDATLKLGYSF
ncbi:MAG: hypothetical protein MJY56_02490 [Bacteroidales bacterium]|nr:hypothetical protein [Bacteroidales bacterium]